MDDPMDFDDAEVGIMSPTRPTNTNDEYQKVCQVLTKAKLINHYKDVFFKNRITDDTVLDIEREDLIKFF